MSASPYMYLEYFNGKKWESVAPRVPDFKGEKLEIADFSYPNGCHDIFSILGYENCGDYEGMLDGVIRNGIPADASEYVKSEYDKYCDGHATYVNLADLYIEYLKNPSVRDYDREWEDDDVFYKENPIKNVIDRASAFIMVWNSNRYEFPAWSQLRIIGWVNY